MNKKFVFAIYIGHNFTDDIMQIHFKCIERFAHVFDEIEIGFIVDDDYNKDYLIEAQERFIKIFLGKKVTFSFFKNSPYRESSVFKELVADRLKDEELVFFAHSKGVTNVDNYVRDQVYTWVTAMYYYSLNFIDDVVKRLGNEKYYSYGTFLSKNDEPEHCNKYGWYYIGTFFWVNCRKLWQYMVNNEIDVPVMGDRFYAEEFLGNIIPTWPLVTTASYGSMYLVNAYDYYRQAKKYLNDLYGGNMDDFKEFYNSLGLEWKD